ncbi:MAG: GAF domain-containing protein [Planctomycetes bacterium]|nr:GAF domain-containing protein [Planctomycetota bacterium]
MTEPRPEPVVEDAASAARPADRPGLAQVAGALADAATLEAVIEALAPGALGVRAVALFCLASDGEALERLTGAEADERALAAAALRDGGPRATTPPARRCRCAPAASRGRPRRDPDGRLTAPRSSPPAALVGQALERARLAGAAARAEATAQQRQREAELLLRVSDAVGRADTLDEVLEPALDAVCVALRVDRAAVLIGDDAGVMRFRAWRGLSDGYRRAVEGHSPWRVGDPDPRPLFVPDADADADLAAYRPLLRAEEVAALGFVPLVAQRRLLGKLMVYARAPRAFSEHDDRLARAVAAQVAQAIRRTELLASERRERDLARRLADQASRLQAVTAALSTASSVSDVAAVIVIQGAAAAGAATAGLWLLDEADAALELTSQQNFSAAADAFRRLPLDHPRPVPVLDAVRRGEAVFLEDRRAFAARYPDIERVAAPRPELAIAALPLLVGGCVGALALTFDEARAFTSDERHALLLLARHCAQAIGRARLFDLEARARAEAEAAQQRTSFLLTASALLASSLDFEETLRRLPRLAVPRVADGFAVELATERGRSAQPLALAHVDPERMAALQELRRRWPPDPDAPHGAPRVIRTGRSALYAVVDDALLNEVAVDAEHLRALRTVGIASALIVPMEARGRTYGALAFYSGAPGRFGEQDLQLAELLGRRAGIAIDNALLYRTAQAAVRAREKVLAVVSHDLRGPLQVVQMGAAALQRVEPAPPVVRRTSGSILRAGERMSRLIEDLLDFTGIQGDRLAIAAGPCRAEEVVAATLETFAALASERGVRLAADVAPDLPGLHADRDRLIQALGNLVSNAVRVTPEGGRVVVRARAEGGELALAVEDTGPGLDPREVARLFEPFWRGEQVRYKGTGLGLAIAKAIAEGHGGRISADGRPGAGSTFTLAVPLQARPQPSKAGDRAARPWDDGLGAAPAIDVGTPEEAPRRHHDLFMQTPAPICILRGHDLVFELANGSFLAATSRRDVVGRRLLDAFPELAGQGLDELFRDVLRSGSPYVGDELLLRLDRTGTGALEDSYWSISLSPLRDGGRADRVVAIGFDRTAQVRQRRELELARGRAEAASRAKDEFFAVLGHELRNPIAPIVTALQLMRLRPDAPFARERALIERQVGHVKRLVDDLLDVSRLARGKVTLARRPVDLARALARAVDAAAPLLEERRHRLAMDVPAAASLVVLGDEDRLVQVAASLLTNAAQHMDQGGTVRLAARRAGDEVTFTVTDDGPGIEAALLPRVFEPFVQGRRPDDRVQGGLGLGLSIVRSLVELHGGTVAAASPGRGQGSAFTVALPAAPAEEAAAGPDRAAPAARARRVLVVDDNRDAADLLAEALTALGHEARRAFDAPSALEVAAEFAPEVALLDLGLPIMNGWELARRLRELPACRGARLFAVTGYGLDADVERSREAGFERHFVKPVDLEVIVEAIEEAVDAGPIPAPTA